MNIEIVSHAFGPVETNCVLLFNNSSKEALIFDTPAGCSAWVKRECEQRDCTLVAVLLTHSHWDHTADIGEFLDLPIYIHEADNYRMEAPMDHTLWPLPFTISPVTNAQFVADKQTLELAGVSIDVLHTPGHTEGGVCFRIGKHVVVGDTIFRGSVGRTDLPGGDYQTLMNSIKLLIETYSDDMKLYPGHGPTTNVAFERQHNPFVREAFL